MNRIELIVRKAMDRVVVFLPPVARESATEQIIASLREHITPIDENLDKLGPGSTLNIIFNGHGRWDQWRVTLDTAGRRFGAEGTDLDREVGTVFDNAAKATEEKFWFYDGAAMTWSVSTTKEISISMGSDGKSIEWATVRGTTRDRQEKLNKLVEAVKETL